MVYFHYLDVFGQRDTLLRMHARLLLGELVDWVLEWSLLVGFNDDVVGLINFVPGTLFGACSILLAFGARPLRK